MDRKIESPDALRNEAHREDVIRLLFRKVKTSKIAGMISLILVVNALELVSLSLFVPIIDSFQGNKFMETSGLTHFLTAFVTSIGLTPSLMTFLMLLSLLFVFKSALTLWQRLLSVNVAACFQDSLRMELLRAFLDSKMDFVNGKRQGALLSVLNEHTVRTSQAFFLLIQSIVLWITVIVYGGFVIWISWRITLVAFLLGLVVSPLIIRVGRKAHLHGKAYSRALEDSQHRALEVLNAKKLVNAMNWGSAFENSFQASSASVRDHWKWMAFWSNSLSIIVQPISVVILSVIIGMSLKFNLEVALLGTYVLAFIRMLPTVQSAIALGTSFLASKPSISRVFELIDESKRAIEPNGGVPFSGFRKDIRLVNVRYCHEGRESILNEVNLEILKGQIVAIVGASGSGKTTIVDLVLGLYRPDSGKILIDGTDLASLDLRQYRSYIGYVPQEPILFHESIRNNLLVGIERSVEDEELKEVCEQVGAWEFILQCREGLETVIGDRGVQLSGGQRQRLALARVLLRKPEILILDEATSALDNESDQWVRNLLSDLRIKKGITFIVIAHRFTTIEDSDQIYLIDNGRSTLLGNWEEAKPGLLVRQQR